MSSGEHCCRDFVFRFGDCDCYKRASVFTIMKLLTELSGEDYENRGLGHTFLMEQGQAFFISRMRLEVERFPRYTEKVTAETWERFAKGPYFYRDYLVKTESGETIIRGGSMWLLIDTASREILRPSALYGGFDAHNEECSGCGGCKRLKLNPELPVLGLRPIYFSDLDGNGHVNNAVYSKIASDFLPEVLHEKPFKAIDINFSMETKFGGVLEICGGETPNGYAVQGASKDALHFACEFEY